MIALGVRCEALLKSVTFPAVIGHLADSYLAQITGSELHEQKKREGLYHQHRALQDIVGQLNAFVATKDRLLAQREEEEQAQ